MRLRAIHLVLLLPLVAALAPGGTFIDDDNNIHEGDIEAIYAEGITVGCNPPDSDRYCPDDYVAREQMAAFLVRAFDLTGTSPGGAFSDVTDDNQFRTAINILATAGVTKGCDSAGTRYCPGSYVTREQMAAFISRASGLTEASGEKFIDVAGNNQFATEIDRLATAEVTKGCNPPENTRFCPKDRVTRGQMASFLARSAGLEAMDVPPRPEPGAEGCEASGSDDPNGAFTTVRNSGKWANGHHAVRVEVEQGVSIDADCFADEVFTILNDSRGWNTSFRQVDGPSYGFRVMLTSPNTVDRLCAPLETAGIYSCRIDNQVVLNVWRWRNGADAFGGDMTTYRQYLVNHETGHMLGHGHRGCPAAGEPAPVMMQQTKYTAPCYPNGWPLSYER